jgi:hypothetical protein
MSTRIIGAWDIWLKSFRAAGRLAEKGQPLKRIRGITEKKFREARPFFNPDFRRCGNNER